MITLHVHKDIDDPVLVTQLEQQSHIRASLESTANSPAVFTRSPAGAALTFQYLLHYAGAMSSKEESFIQG